MAQIFFTKSERRPSAFATLGLVILFLAITTLTGAGPILGYFQQTSGIPEEVFLWRLKLLDLVTMLLLGGSAATLIGILHGRFSNRVRTSWRGFLAVVLAVAVAVPLWFFEQAKSKTAPLHDVTTDLADPPYFRKLEERSYDTSNPTSMMGGRLDLNYKQIHQAAYGEFSPLEVTASTKQTLNAVQRVAERLGWTVESVSQQYGQVEASYLSTLLQLRSNIVIRVRSVDTSTKTLLDIRAVSLLGVSDYGINARLLREFLSEIQKELP